jgi:hypothetical protein
MGFAHESIGHELNPDWQAQFDTIQRVDASEMTYEQFVEQFERPGIPVILTGLTSGWRANERWDFKVRELIFDFILKSFLKDLLRGYRNQKFKCGEDDDGYSVKLKMKYYLDYMFGQGMGPNMDDSPLYIFDSGFGDVSSAKKELKIFLLIKLLNNFSDQKPPKCFRTMKCHRCSRMTFSAMPVRSVAHHIGFIFFKSK